MGQPVLRAAVLAVCLASGCTTAITTTAQAPAAGGDAAASARLAAKAQELAFASATNEVIEEENDAAYAAGYRKGVGYKDTFPGTPDGARLSELCLALDRSLQQPDAIFAFGRGDIGEIARCAGYLS